MNKYICIHGHFYQPPRENPWLEEIEYQDSAYPYKDWNERITAECYMPNTSSRILDHEGKVVDILNNYRKISFNFGPTLLSWFEKHAPKVYERILQADKESIEKFSGHGSAMAQVYNHIIMPLANRQDKITQIIWGIADFEYRFRRKPEGMWLAETAVDDETLELLVDNGIKFTILSPYQASKIKKIDHDNWIDISGGRIDPKRPYLYRLPNNKSIVLFFYDGPMSQDIAFGDLLKDGVKFTNRLLAGFDDRHEDQLVSVGTDGETYGHHHKFGNMALSFFLDNIEKNKLAKITVYGEYIANHPCDYQVEIIQNSSWSCAHGVERWRADCGCNVGTNSKWNQSWRVYLRNTMDWLRDELIKVYEEQLSKYVEDVWEVRNDYINVLLDRSTDKVDNFIKKHAKRVSEDDKIVILKLLELQRNAMLMYTSCGWFFDDISGIEPIQIIQYAARAMQLAKETAGIDLEPGFLSKIEKARSNSQEMQDGKHIYLTNVKPSVIDLLDIGAHYAMYSLFDSPPRNLRLHTFDIQSVIYEKYIQDKHTLIVGKALLKSIITFEEKMVNFSLLHLGDTNLTAGVRIHTDDDYFKNVHKKLKIKFIENKLHDVIKLINEYFEQNNYTLWDLFKNEQGKVLNNIFEETQSYIDNQFREIYRRYHPLMEIRRNLRVPLPKILAVTVEFILNRDLCSILDSNKIDIMKLEKTVKEIKRLSFMRDKKSVALIASRRINLLMDHLEENPEDIKFLGNIEACIRILNMLNLELDLWEPQNTFFRIAKKTKPIMNERIRKHDKNGQFWIECFDKLGEYLKINISV